MKFLKISGAFCLFRSIKIVEVIYRIRGWIICSFLDMMCRATTANFSSLFFISARSCSPPSCAFLSAILHRVCVSLTFFLIALLLLCSVFFGLPWFPPFMCMSLCMSLSHNSFNSKILWDVKEPTHLSKRVGHEVPGVVAALARWPARSIPVKG